MTGEERYTIACFTMLAALIIVGFFLPPIDTYCTVR